MMSERRRSESLGAPQHTLDAPPIQPDDGGGHHHDRDVRDQVAEGCVLHGGVGSSPRWWAMRKPPGRDGQDSRGQRPGSAQQDAGGEDEDDVGGEGRRQHPPAVMF